MVKSTFQNISCLRLIPAADIEKGIIVAFQNISCLRLMNLFF